MRHGRLAGATVSGRAWCVVLAALALWPILTLHAATNPPAAPSPHPPRRCLGATQTAYHRPRDAIAANLFAPARHAVFFTSTPRTCTSRHAWRG